MKLKLLVAVLLIALSPTARAQDDAGQTTYAVVRTRPVGGSLWLTSVFLFKLCESRGGNPWNVRECSWEEVEPGTRAKLDGTYYYIVSWGNNQRICGRRAINGVVPGGAEPVPTITLSANSNNRCPAPAATTSTQN
jgi:hypothetical protein